MKFKLKQNMDPWTNLANDVRIGLTSMPKFIPSKYFYDRRGSRLFDEICSLPEYYQTRTEKTLLEDYSPEIVRLTRAQEVVELGSGVALKTKVLIESFLDYQNSLTYIPMDISASALEWAQRRLHAYTNLTIHPLVGDYTRNLSCISPHAPCLVLFLGSTIGNLDPEQTQLMLTAVAERLNPGDWFLLGVDLMKAPSIIEAAYNDSCGVTSEFNKNILRVVNRHLEGNFKLEDFKHIAFLNMENNQIEMHLTAQDKVTACLKKIHLEVEIEKGESILTEISRKFDKNEIDDLFKKAGFQLKHWLSSDNGYFALALSELK